MSVVVMGAGAAGLTAGVFAARAGVPVTVVETRPRPGAKIRVSGGGRCNVLPSRVALEDFHTSGSIHTMRNILFSWPLDEVKAFFEDDLGVALKVESSGKVFPRSDKSKDVIDALLAALQRSGASLRAPFRVTSIARRPHGGFTLTSAEGEQLDAARLVLATGGLSLPKTGSDGAGLAMARRLGHQCVPTYPVLVPLLSSDSSWRDLSGVAVPVRLTAERAGRRIAACEGDFLFTHRGFSGPVVLDVSRHVTEQESDIVLRVHWGGRHVPDWDVVLQQGGRATVGSVLRRHLPSRLGPRLVERTEVDLASRISELKRELRQQLVATLSHFELPVRGSEGYATAEATGGGIPLDEIVPASLESRVVPGLHFCGEILDVTGRIGGYNFLWAWVTGRKAGQGLAAKT